MAPSSRARKRAPPYLFRLIHPIRADMIARMPDTLKTTPARTAVAVANLSAMGLFDVRPTWAE